MASTIDDTKPLTNALVTSSVLRALAAAAKFDIEALQTAIGGMTDPLTRVLTGFTSATGTITSADTILSAIQKLYGNKDVSNGYAGLTLFKINFQNTANTFTSLLTNSNTAVRTYTFPDSTGVVALAEDTSNAASKTTPVDADLFSLFDSVSSFGLKKLSFLNLKLAITDWNNPIGTIRHFNVATNPNILLGIGTWSLYGVGRVSVCIDTSQTEFDTLGETGGAKTHLLTSAESGLPAHNHPLSNGGNVISSGAADAGIPASGSFFRATTIGNNAAANASTAHNNLQPYIVDYHWVRTA